jgi:carbon monoxide dehydrogenase subunit G
VHLEVPVELVNEFTVEAPVARVWQTVGDLRQVAQCLPGAVIDSVQDSPDGEVYRGRVAIKVGPIGLGLAGTATVLDRDDERHRMVVKGNARDRNGQGGADARITVTAEAAGSATRVRVVTDLGLSGKIAQFGSGLITGVSGRIVKQFVHKLSALVIPTGELPRTAAAQVMTTSGAVPIGGPTTAATVPTERLTTGAAAIAGPARAVAPAALVAIAGMIFGWALGRAIRLPAHATR